MLLREFQSSTALDGPVSLCKLYRSKGPLGSAPPCAGVPIVWHRMRSPAGTVWRLWCGGGGGAEIRDAECRTEAKLR